MILSASIFATHFFPERRSLVDKLISQNIFQDLSPAEYFSKLHTSGVDGVELLIPSRFSEDDFVYIENILHKNKMTVAGIHQPIRLMTITNIEEIKKMFVIADKLHAKVVVLHISSLRNQIFDTNFVTAIHELEKKCNIKVGIENNQKQINYIHKKHIWDSEEFSALMKKTKLGITLDLTHIGISKGNIIDFFNYNKEQIVNVHIGNYKDHSFSTTLRPTAYTHLPIGKGELPIEEFLTILKQSKYAGLLTIEINSNQENVCNSAKIIRNILN